MELPTGLQTESAENTATENVSLEAAIEKSKSEITEAQTAPLKKRKRPSTGRPVGRPPKKPVAEAAGPSVASAASTDPSVGAEPQMDITPVLETVLKFPFDVVATRTNVPEMALTAEEVKAPANLANQLFNLYAPELTTQDPRRVLAMSLAMTLTMIAVTKMQVYSEIVARKAIEGRTQSETQQPNAPVPIENAGPLPQIPFARNQAMSFQS